MNWIKNGLILTASFVFALLLAEILVRFTFPQDLSGTWLVKDDFGLMLNKSSGDSFHSHGSRKAKYVFGNFGVRRSFKPMSKTNKKVLVLGDSFTFGWLLNVEDTYVYQLARANSDKLFLNAAAGGWGAADYTAYMESYCADVNPDIAMIIMNADDIARMLRSDLYVYNQESKSIHRAKYLPSQPDRLKTFLNSFSLYQVLLVNSHLLQLSRSVYFGNPKVGNRQISTFSLIGLMNGVDLNYSNQFSAEIFRYLNVVAKECGAELRIAYTGLKKNNSEGTYPTLEFLEFAKKINMFERLDVPFIDLTNTPQMKAYRADLSRYTIVGDSHPNEAGSNLLFEALNQSGILKN
jgi:hypothetical protein